MTFTYFRMSLRLEVSEKMFVKKKFVYLVIFKTLKYFGTGNLPKEVGRSK